MAKRILRTALVALLLLFWAGTAPAVWVGDPAPDFAIRSLDGERIELAEFKGKKPLMLVFWATWCPICRHEVPSLNRIYEEFKGRGLEVLGVNVAVNDSVRKAVAYRDELGVAYPLAFDEGRRVTSAYGVSGTPTVIILDRRGVVRYRSAAVPDDLAEHFDRLVE